MKNDLHCQRGQRGTEFSLDNKRIANNNESEEKGIKLENWKIRQKRQKPGRFFHVASPDR